MVKDRSKMNANQLKADDNGWLDDNGICQFPRDVIAVPNGLQAPGMPHLEKLTPEKLQEAVDKGLIRFEDGNGDFHTASEYSQLFPEYPDVLWMLEQQGRWPPKAAHNCSTL